MKILHTADWHIGKVLHKSSLQDEMELFLDWLLDVIEKEKIDLLLVSGDIFDVANPAIKDRGVYYKFLSKLIGTGLQVIITGGNHDSIGMLDAPQEILKHINISVIGGAKQDLADEIVEVKDSNGKLALVVAAVPFLRDKDLRSTTTDEQYKDRAEAIRGGIANHYKHLGLICEEKYPDVPSIAMGHLYARGVSTSDSERDIHIGNAAAVESTVFPSSFDYVALGHIHRPQVIGGNSKIRYSGSPIALSFSEKSDEKCVLIIEIENGEVLEPKVLEVPKSRALKKIVGDYESVREQLGNYKPEFELPSFVEIEVLEDEFSSVVLSNVEELINKYRDNSSFRILKSRTHFKSGAKDTSDLFEQGANIEDLTPKEVFAKRIESESLDEAKKALLNEAFIELIEDLT